MRSRSQRLPRGWALGLALVMALPLPAASQDDPRPLPPRPTAASGHLPLEGTRWRLRDYRWRDAERTSGPEVAAWMSLRNGRLRGSGGCTSLRGRYTTMGDALDIDVPAARDLGCAKQTTLVQLGMVDGLRRAASFEIVPGESSLDDELSVRGTGGDELLRLIVDDSAVLERTDWTLATYTVDGERVAADGSQPAVLQFRPERASAARRRSNGAVVGSSGCNGVVGPYSRRADVLSFGRLELTEAPCTESLSRQEAAMMSVLDASALRLDLPPDRLVLTSGDSGASLEFEAAAPLEGTTWLLASLRDARGLSGPVTLRLAGGVASGQGPCGPLRADYATDGIFLSFGAVSGSDGDGCEDRRAERVLLSALRHAVMVERTAARLRLLDTAGRTLLRLKRAGGP